LAHIRTRHHRLVDLGAAQAAAADIRAGEIGAVENGLTEVAQGDMRGAERDRRKIGAPQARTRQFGLREVAGCEIAIRQIMISEAGASPTRLAREKTLVQVQRLFERLGAQSHPTLRGHGIHIEGNHVSFETIPTLLKNAYQKVDPAAERSEIRLSR
jgi:hypothetical protein